MSFKNLEDRFNKTVDKLYAGANTKFADGKPSRGRTDAPLLTRKPGDSQAGIRVEGRSLPFVSAARDLKRLTLFSISTNGLKFLAKQQLLQTGNTFEMTRIINPLFVVGNAIPFLHVKRNARPLSEFAGKTDTSDSNVRKLGQMQVGSYNDLRSAWKTPQFIKVTSPASAKKSNIFGILGKAAKNLVAQAISPLKNTISALTAKRNIGDKFGYGDKYSDYGGWNKSRPEMDTIVALVNSKNKEYQTSVEELYKSNGEYTTPFIKYFRSEGISSLPEGQSVNDNEPISIKIKKSAEEKRIISYVKDPLNSTTSPNKDGNYVGNARPPYRDLQMASVVDGNAPMSADGTSDQIIVSFAMGNDDHVQFRAFIRDLQQTANPEYKEYQYIGRIEKFISYTTVRRTISFKLDILSFSPEELPVVWKKINYLTGLVFPYGVNRGILQPNICRLTIGQLYVNQPGYITQLQTNFTETSPMWDIDQQVPIGATLQMSYNLIEKQTALSDTPFYGITEADGAFNRGFTSAGEFISTEPVTPVTTLGGKPNTSPVSTTKTQPTDYSFKGQPISSGLKSRFATKP